MVDSALLSLSIRNDSISFRYLCLGELRKQGSHVDKSNRQRSANNKQMQEGFKKLFDLLLWPVLVLFLLASMLAILHWYMALDLDGFSLDDFSNGYLLLGILCHICALVAVILAWHWNLRFHGVRGLGLLHSAVMVGFYAVGKYTPGKIWGMVARGAALYRISREQKGVILPTLTEQVALVHSGIVIAAFGFLAAHEYFAVMIVFALLVFPSIWCVARGGGLILRMIRLFDKRNRFEGVVPTVGFKESYPWIFLILAIMWVLASLVLWCCVQSYGAATPPGFPQVAFVTITAYLGGFAAFFSLAGLGVREGVIVAMLGPYLGTSAALYVSLIHRLITAGCDVALGLVSLLFLNSSAEKRQE
jgi:uncharacterized membrane protein YbhN (UPF0104 family)